MKKQRFIWGRVSQPLTFIVFLATSFTLLWPVSVAAQDLSSFSVFATNTVCISDGTSVNSGDIGSEDASSGPWLCAHSEVAIDKNTYVADGVSIYADSLKIKSGASVFDVYYNGLNNSGTIRGDEYTPLALPLDVILPEFPTPAPGIDNYDIAQGETLTLDPGAYGEIMVRENATLILTGCTYHIENLDLADSGSKVLFQAPTDLIINNRLEPGQGAVIGPDDGSGISANDIRIYVNGINGSNGQLGAIPKAVQVGSTNTLQANIYAPNGTLLIEQGTIAGGAFIGKDVEVESSVQINLNSGFTSPITGSHDIHTRCDARGPQPGLACGVCHDVSPIKNACTTCHSPGGAYDGVDDPVIGAWTNWADGVYESDGVTLKTGKEQWCVGCHDDDSTTDTNESALINGVHAPGIAGVSFTPDETWYSPISVIPPQFGYLIDGNTATGNMGEPFFQAEFDLGGSYVVTDMQLYVGFEPYYLRWQVLAWTGTEWIPVLGGNQEYYGWRTGDLGQGWYQAKVDVAVWATKLKLVKLGPPVVIPNMIFEFQYKKDNLSYGYFFGTGHGIACSNCHDFTQVHIDGDPRTYDAEAAPNNYQTGYRLKLANVVPRPAGSYDIADFGLCLKSGCHPSDAFYTGGGPITLTNFRDDGEGVNDHVRHLETGTYLYFDSDFDGVEDSDLTCTACHNVHGSPTPAMIRHGELNGHVPGLNFRYLDSNGDPDGYLMEAYPDSSGAVTYWYGPGQASIAKNGICRMCHNDAITYMRAPENLTMPSTP